MGDSPWQLTAKGLTRGDLGESQWREKPLQGPWFRHLKDGGEHAYKGRGDCGRTVALQNEEELRASAPSGCQVHVKAWEPL